MSDSLLTNSVDDLLATIVGADDDVLGYRWDSAPLAFQSSLDGRLGAPASGSLSQMAVDEAGFLPLPPPDAVPKFGHAQAGVKIDPTAPMDQDPPLVVPQSPVKHEASEVEIVVEDPIDGNAGEGGAGRSKHQERLNEVAEGWRVVSCLDHKDDYELCINTNAKNRANKLYFHLCDPENNRPPKGYKGECIDRLLLVDGALIAIIWCIPGNRQFFVASFEVMYTANRSGAARATRWKHPRHVIDSQIEVSQGAMSPAVVAQVWTDLLSQVRGSELIVLDTAAANTWLHESIVQNAGCFFYGPSTTKYDAVLTHEGIEYIKQE